MSILKAPLTENYGHKDGEYAEEPRPNAEFGDPFWTKQGGYQLPIEYSLWGFNDLMIDPRHIDDFKLELRSIVDDILENGTQSYPGAALMKDRIPNKDEPYLSHQYVLSIPFGENKNGKQIENIIVISKEQYQKIDNAGNK
jgi:hypothetical protein